MPITQHHPLILASGSAARQQLMKAVGLNFSVEPSGVDEEAVTATIAHLPLPERALALAKAKAIAVGKQHAQAYTIGADQICALGDAIMHKPGSFENASAQLAMLSGQTHLQHCGVVIAHGGHIIWEHVAVASLTMRRLTMAEINAYLAADAPLQSCGAYRFESMGRHLFSEVEGDHDVIKGLPMVALLNRLYALRVIGLGRASVQLEFG